MNAADMIAECFRRQHPEAYGHDSVPEPVVPSELRYGAAEVYKTSDVLAEEPMGAPDAVPLTRR